MKNEAKHDFTHLRMCDVFRSEVGMGSLQMCAINFSLKTLKFVAAIENSDAPSTVLFERV